MNVDIVVVTYNSAEHLPTLFAALPDEVAVTVVDNASSDDSAEVAERLGATVLRGEVNAGFAAGCNRGAQLGDADVVLFLNPDAVIEPASLKELLAAFDDPAVGVASPMLRRSDGSAQRVRWPCPSAPGAWTEALGLHLLRRRAQVEAEGDGFVVGACFAVRRAAFEVVGGFDERFWLYGEECDLCYCLHRQGWAVRVVPEAVSAHVGGASADGEAVRGFAAEHFARGGEHFVAKHQGRRALVSYRLANLVGSALRAGLGRGARVVEHRRRFRRTAKMLRENAATVPLDSPATRAPGKGLVVCSLEAWDEVWRRNQFLVRELLTSDADLRVLFVEPSFDVVHEARRRSGRRHIRGLRPVDGMGRVVRVEPVKWLPRRLGPWADRWRDRQVQRAVARLGFVEPVLWVNDPTYATLADAVRWPAVYDITDDWTQAADPRTAATARRSEERLFGRCDAVVVCSEGLARSRRAARPDLVVIPNAVDVERFRSVRQRPQDFPSGDVAVYVGTLHEDRLDVELLEELARELPEVTVLLVGPDCLTATSRARLSSPANLILAGPRPYEEVPGYLQHASVVIVPHVVSPFTESLDPIKAYECLAVGRPTVATPVAGFRGAGSPVVVAGRRDFVPAVSDALRVAPVAAAGKPPTWTDRAVAFRRALLAARERATLVMARPDGEVPRDGSTRAREVG